MLETPASDFVPRRLRQPGARIRGEENHWRIRTWAAVDEVVRIGAARYRRNRDLPRLLPSFALWRTPLEAERRLIVAEIRRAMMRERALGASGHRAYNIQRHMALAQALKAEEAALKQE